MIRQLQAFGRVDLMDSYNRVIADIDKPTTCKDCIYCSNCAVSFGENAPACERISRKAI